MVEIGGTVGDIESLPFLEAIRQMRVELGRENALFMHLTLVPYIRTAGEIKTKPTQHSVKELRSIGIQPDILLCRAEQRLPDDERREDRALHQRARGRRSSPPWTRTTSTASRACCTPRGSTTWWCASSGWTVPAADLSEWDRVLDGFDHPAARGATWAWSASTWT